MLVFDARNDLGKYSMTFSYTGTGNIGLRITLRHSADRRVYSVYTKSVKRATIAESKEYV